MFTKEYLQELNTLSKNADAAEKVLYKLNRLQLLSANLKKKLDTIVKKYDDANQEALNYMLSFMPQELQDKLTIERMTGAFITSITGNIAFKAEMRLWLKGGFSATLKFDNEKKCLYHQSWIENKLISNLLDKYLENNSQFDCWIRYK